MVVSRRYSQVNKQVVGFMPVYGAEVSEVDEHPTQFRLRDGFNDSVVEHIFVAANPKERAVCTLHCCVALLCSRT